MSKSYAFAKNSGPIPHSGLNADCSDNIQISRATRHSFISSIFMKLFNLSPKNLIETLNLNLILRRVAIFVPIVLLTFFVQAQEAMKVSPEMEAQVRKTLKENGNTVRFMENKGQLKNPNVLYYLEGKQGSVYIEKNKIRFSANEFVTLKKESEIFENNGQPVTEEEFIQTGIHNFSVDFVNANSNPKIVLGESFKTNYNFILGDDPKDWVSKVKAAKDLILEEVYPGIDLRLYSNLDGALEFDWILKPGADFSKIQMNFDGHDKLKIAKDGSLKVELRFTEVAFNIPESYQVSEQGKFPVDFKFNEIKKNLIGFHTKSKIDPMLPLVIDPTLVWGSYMDGDATGATFDEYLFAIQLDTTDFVMYCAGATNKNIPTTVAPYDANGYLNTITGLNGGSNVSWRTSIVYRISPSGNDLIDLTLYGPASISVNQQNVAHSLSLSQNRVFIEIGRAHV